MTSVKVCSRDDCSPVNVKPDLTTKCSNCADLLHLPCIGISLKVQQLNSPNIKILCNKCVNIETSDSPPAELNISFSANASKNTPSKKTKFTNESIVNELNALKKAIELNTLKLDEISVKTTDIHTKTDLLVSKTKQSSFAPNIQPTVSTPKSSKKSVKPNAKTPIASFADIVSSNVQSAKRKRTEVSAVEFVAPKASAPKFNAPKAKVGTKVSATGLSAAPKREPKPKFTKSVWVGQLDKSTDENDMIEYIVENTPLKNASQFRVRSLLKKGKDVSKMNFVSFKVDVAEEHFACLMDENVWPEGSEVREFINHNKTLGDYFPALNKNSEQKNVTQSTEPTESMEIPDSPTKTQAIPTVQSPSQMPAATPSHARSPSK